MTCSDGFEGGLEVDEGLDAMIFAVAMSEAMQPQARPPSSWPANSAFFLVRAIGPIRF